MVIKLDEETEGASEGRDIGTLTCGLLGIWPPVNPSYLTTLVLTASGGWWCVDRARLYFHFIHFFTSREHRSRGVKKSSL